MSYQNDISDLDRATNVLRDGGTVAFPTETVYGLGANAWLPEAVAKVYEIKARPRFNPLIVHVADRDRALRLASGVPDAAVALMDRFWPGPLTLVLQKSPAIPDIVTAGLPSVAVRVPDHPLALALLRRAEVPVAAPSANLFGRISPTTAAHVRDQLGGKVDVILDGGPCKVGLESTIISFAMGPATLLRQGGLPREDIEAVVGALAVPAGKAILAPGMLEKHYAPLAPLFFVDKLEKLPPGRIGLICLTPPRDAGNFEMVVALSPSGDLKEAASNLFAGMRRLEKAGLDAIIALEVPDEGIGLAINDRLRRASHQ